MASIQGKWTIIVATLSLTAGILLWQKVNTEKQSELPVPEGPPIRAMTAGIPDAAKVGDVETSIARFKELLAKYEASNWNPRNLKKADMILPDGRFAEDSVYRMPGMPHVNLPGGEAAMSPEMDPIAFWTEIYARMNPVAYKGDMVKRRPTGFYLVAWKDGKIEKVPVQDVRLISKAGGHFPVFPGMPAYNTSLMRLPGVEFADGNRNTSRARAYTAQALKNAKAHYLKSKQKSGDCPTCSKD
jgi:hypothetical protein